jgi:hypothetical protein
VNQITKYLNQTVMKKAIKYILMGVGALVIVGMIGAALSSPSKKSGADIQTSPTKNEVKTNEPQKEDLEILQQTAKTETLEGSNIITIHAQVQNNTDELKDYVEVKATFYDKNGKLVGTGMGNTTNLAAHAKRVIDIQGMDIDNGAKYELEVKDSPF